MPLIPNGTNYPLRTLLHQYRSLFEQVEQGFGIAEILLSSTGKPTDVRWVEINPAFTQLTGLTSEQLQDGRTVRSLNLPIEEEWFAHYEHVVRSQQAEHFELFVSRVNKWFEVHAVPLADSEPPRLGVLFNNITPRKQAAQQQQLAAVLEGQEEERRRIAESLHDGLGQLLFAVKLQLEQLPVLPDVPAQREAAKLLREAIRQVRTLSHELTPSILADFGLRKAITTICQQLSSTQLSWHCYVEVDEAAPLPLALQQVIYRLAQTLAHNVAQHAQASEATLEVETLAEWLVLRVEDNGRGFDLADTRQGLGLRTLRSRVALLHGTVQVDTAPGQGTQIQVHIPLGAFPAAD